MSASDKKLMEEIFAGLANRNGTLLVERMSDDFRWINIGTSKWSATFDGKAAVLRDLLAPLRARLVERSRTVAHRFIADGDYVIAEARGDNATRAGSMQCLAIPRRRWRRQGERRDKAAISEPVNAEYR